MDRINYDETKTTEKLHSSFDNRLPNVDLRGHQKDVGNNTELPTRQDVPKAKNRPMKMNQNGYKNVRTRLKKQSSLNNFEDTRNESVNAMSEEGQQGNVGAVEAGRDSQFYLDYCERIKNENKNEMADKGLYYFNPSISREISRILYKRRLSKDEVAKVKGLRDFLSKCLFYVKMCNELSQNYFEAAKREEQDSEKIKNGLGDIGYISTNIFITAMTGCLTNLKQHTGIENLNDQKAIPKAAENLCNKIDSKIV